MALNLCLNRVLKAFEGNGLCVYSLKLERQQLERLGMNSLPSWGIVSTITLVIEMLFGPKILKISFSRRLVLGSTISSNSPAKVSDYWSRSGECGAGPRTLLFKSLERKCLFDWGCLDACWALCMVGSIIAGAKFMNAIGKGKWRSLKWFMWYFSSPRW